MTARKTKATPDHEVEVIDPRLELARHFIASGLADVDVDQTLLDALRVPELLQAAVRDEVRRSLTGLRWHLDQGLALARAMARKSAAKAPVTTKARKRKDTK